MRGRSPPRGLVVALTCRRAHLYECLCSGGLGDFLSARGAGLQHFAGPPPQVSAVAASVWGCSEVPQVRAFVPVLGWGLLGLLAIGLQDVVLWAWPLLRPATICWMVVVGPCLFFVVLCLFVLCSGHSAVSRQSNGIVACCRAPSQYPRCKKYIYIYIYPPPQ